MDNQTGKVNEVQHPLISHKLAILRDKNTSYIEFKTTLTSIATIIAYEATKNLAVVEKRVETPVATANCHVLKSNKITLIPILRAGLGLVDGIEALMPDCKIGHMGISRDEETLKPKIYYCKLPDDIAESEVFVLDPMLATGGTIVMTITELKKRGVTRIRLVTLVSCPEGIKNVHQHHPEIDIYTAKIDEKLNEKGYIIPGLGDAGDRIFGTKESFVDS